MYLQKADSLDTSLMSNFNQPGANVMITNFSDFRRFWREIGVFFLKTNVIIEFLHFLVKKRQFFGENLL
jgi:hypothetical protein